jgi:hypothetical protein
MITLRSKLFNQVSKATWLCVLCSSILLCIWVIPETIALRNIILILGFFSSLFVIKQNWSIFKNARTKLAPLLILSTLFLWVGIHYLFFSLNPDLELQEILSLWARTFLGFVLAVGLAISMRKNSALLAFFYVAIFSTSIINLGSYVYASYLNSSFLKPGMVLSFLFNKIETAYFGAIAGSVAVGNLIALLTCPLKKENILQVVFYLIGFVLILTSAILSNTKNGVAILGLLFIMFLAVILVHYLLRSQSFKVINIVAIAFIVVFTGVAIKYHKETAAHGWSTIFHDVAVAIDIDGNRQWQKKEGSVQAPLNSLGQPAALNTYSRAAWATVGVRLIGEYPFGYGSVNQSFVGLQKLEGILNENTGQTHSGWVDFGMAFGIPGLVIIFATLLTTIYFGIIDRRNSNLIPVLICLILMPFCLIAEMSYKQYFESLIFFIALSCSMVAFNIFPLEDKIET